MNEMDSDVPVRGSRMRIARSRGAASGFLLILLGAWGALIPFVGPSFDFAYSPDQMWVWTTARGWLEVLPGAVAVVGGVLLLSSRNRATAMLGGWLTVAAGAWFVVGRTFTNLLSMGDPGTPIAVREVKRVALEIAYFSGLGVLIVFLGAVAIGRVSVRSLRDVQVAQSAVVTPEPVTETPRSVVATEPPPSATTEPVQPAFGRHAEPQTERMPVERVEEPEHRGFGWFRRHRQTTTTR
ncbi:MAG: hypothetical protein QOH60_5175 [Mycobacterium sp.]|nr:hypothetical protein [Mycobacterium sp.]